MCIRDSPRTGEILAAISDNDRTGDIRSERGRQEHAQLTYICLLYTSDAADERSSVDLGGRRIIKKKRLITAV